jgi:thiamine biosynthesis protein ThiS
MPQTEEIDIVVNGRPRTAPAGLNVVELLRFLELTPDRVAVELNRSIVRKPEWESTVVAGGAQLEIVQFVGGG